MQFNDNLVPDNTDILNNIDNEQQLPYIKQLQLSHLLLSLSTLINELVISTWDTVEIKTTAKNSEIILWLLKYNSILGFDQLIEITSADFPSQRYRFKMVYVLRNLSYSTTICLTFSTNETNLDVKSIAYLYKSSTWLEREVWDLFGIKFNGNTDLRRILTDYGFSGHPLRKDFPLSGFKELYYDDSNKRIVFEPVQLAQELRIFTFQRH